MNNLWKEFKTAFGFKKEENIERPVGPVLMANNRLEEMKDLLSKEAYELCKKVVGKMVVQDESRNYHKTVSFALIATEHNLRDAEEELAKTINKLVEENLITSVLAAPSTLKLALSFGEYPSQVLFFYPHIPAEKEEYVMKNFKFVTEEGGCGRSFRSNKVQLADGEFLALARITSLDRTQGKEFNLEEALTKEVEKYLRCLPEGTVLVSSRQLGITDLSVPYELTFRNLFLTNVKKVELSYVRQVAPINGQLKSFNLFLGVKYFDKEGKDLFSLSEVEDVSKKSESND